MAIRLFAHTLIRTAASGLDGSSTSFAQRPLEFARWVLDELVGRRCQAIAWSLQQPALRRGAARRTDAAPGDSVWADTQPWCHE